MSKGEAVSEVVAASEVAAASEVVAVSKGGAVSEVVVMRLAADFRSLLNTSYFW